MPTAESDASFPPTKLVPEGAPGPRVWGTARCPTGGLWKGCGVWGVLLQHPAALSRALPAPREMCGVPPRS